MRVLMALAVGSRLGSYEVTAKIGEGGMGEVYRATDTNLGRQVAIKVLPEAFARDAERLARFDREAKTLASLNHPNIAHIYGLERLRSRRTEDEPIRGEASASVRADSREPLRGVETPSNRGGGGVPDASGKGGTPAPAEDERAGQTALVMELVDGPTLADLIAGAATRGRESTLEAEGTASVRTARGGGAPRGLSIDETLPIAKQIAEALEAAHEQGIIHRDLKPANIKVRDDGTVKVLDFGLAKALEPAPGSSSSVSMSPTITTPAQTMQGVILGTAAYMSPEQARGKPVDRRTDIWAFGCVVYEMLTARRAFEGEDVSLTLSAVLQREPDWSALPVALPSALGIFLQRCLQKDPRQRIGDAQDIRLALEGAFETPVAHNEAGAAEPTGWWRTAGVAVVAAVVGGLAVGLMSWEWRTPAPTETVRFNLSTSDGVQLRVAPQALDLAVTPDGTKVVYSAEGDGALAVRTLDQLRATPLATSNVFGPVASPDGAWVAYTDISDGTLKKMSIQGGPPITICPVAGFPRGASWGEDGTIVFATSDLTTGLLQVADGGGDPVVLTTPDESTGEVDHFFPHVLPGGRAIIFTRLLSRDGSRSEIVLLDLASQEQRVLVAEGSHAQYATSGHLVYGVNGTLRAVAFDLA